MCPDLRWLRSDSSRRDRAGTSALALLRSPLLSLVRAPAPARARLAVHRRRSRPADLHLGVRVVAARDPARANPFVTHAVWAPTGSTSPGRRPPPGLALLFAPLTLAVGPVASYNVAAILMPALAAWTAFLLCRHLTRRSGRRLSAATCSASRATCSARSTGHLHMTSRLPRPARRARRLRYLEASSTAGRSSSGSGRCWRSSCSSRPSSRSRCRSPSPCALALALPSRRSAARLVSLARSAARARTCSRRSSPRRFSTTCSPGSSARLPPAQAYDADLLNFVVPTTSSSSAAAGPTRLQHFPGQQHRAGRVSRSARARDRRPVRAAALADRRRPLPARLVRCSRCSSRSGASSRSTGTDRRRCPGRPSAPAALRQRAAGAARALRLARRRRDRRALDGVAPPGAVRWLLPALAVLAIVPNPAPAWATTYTMPPFFTDSAYRGCLAPGEIVLPLPIDVDGDAISGRPRRLPLHDGGRLVPQPARVVHDLRRAPPGSQPGTRCGRPGGVLATYIGAKRVTAVVVDQRRPDSGRERSTGSPRRTSSAASSSTTSPAYREAVPTLRPIGDAGSAARLGSGMKRRARRRGERCRRALGHRSRENPDVLSCWSRARPRKLRPRGLLPVFLL